MKVLYRYMLSCLLLLPLILKAQMADRIVRNNIRSVKLNAAGNQLQYPIIRLNSSDRLELRFDDMDADVKYYSYTFVLCNADWTPAQLSQFDYMRGFSNVRISTYRNSSIALTPYTHYFTELPDRNTFPIRSGNYLLKVFLNGDTTELAFTRRFLVVDNRVTSGATVVQPFNPTLFRSHQKINFQVNVQNIKPTNVFQQIKVVILQNNRWDNALTNLQPTFVRQNILEYNTENDGIFPGQKEWRWVNLTSLRLQTDRIERGEYTNRGQTLFVKPESERKDLRYMFYRDANGMYQLGNVENNNPFWQGDYATVWFRFVPPQNEPYADKDVFVYGELTNYEFSERNKMIFNKETGIYENSQLLKQGLYDYMYLFRDKKTGQFDAGLSEGNWWETENNYTILVYYRPMGGRADELVSITQVNSLANRPQMERRVL